MERAGAEVYVLPAKRERLADAETSLFRIPSRMRPVSQPSSREQALIARIARTAGSGSSGRASLTGTC